MAALKSCSTPILSFGLTRGEPLADREGPALKGAFKWVTRSLIHIIAVPGWKNYQGDLTTFGHTLRFSLSIRGHVRISPLPPGYPSNVVISAGMTAPIRRLDSRCSVVLAAIA